MVFLVISAQGTGSTDFAAAGRLDDFDIFLSPNDRSGNIAGR